jgi:hypothetical protein
MFDDLIALEPDTEVLEPAVRDPIALEISVSDEKDLKTLEEATTTELLSAQARTAHWLEEIGAYTGEDGPPQLSEEQRQGVRDAFAATTNPYVDPMTQKSRLMALSTPQAVRHLAGMLSEYDWEYVKQAKEIRGYIVAKLLEHSKNADPKFSLAALKALGTVTEVGAFTERVEISRPPAEATPHALADAIRSKLNGLRPRTRAELEVPTDVPFVERVEPDDAPGVR